MSAADDLVIAHQLAGEGLAGRAAALERALPPGVRLVALPPERAWDVPPEARALIVVPPRDPRFKVPQAPPPGWPGRVAWVQALSTGVDEYPRWMFDGPVVTCGRGFNAPALAEFVLASLLAVAKVFPDVWIAGPAQWTHRPLGTLHGKTIGLLGLGSIGTEVARRVLPFGAKVLAWRRSDRPSPVDGVALADLDTVLAEADSLVVTLPLTGATRHLLGREAFRKAKPGLHLVNISRGGIVDQEALIGALEQGIVGFASLDVTEPEPLPEGHPLYGHPRVHISPHLSWSGIDPGDAITRLFLENLDRFRTGRDLVERVDPRLGY